MNLWISSARPLKAMDVPSMEEQNLLATSNLGMQATEPDVTLFRRHFLFGKCLILYAMSKGHENI